jgi:hypothetical protein
MDIRTSQMLKTAVEMTDDNLKVFLANQEYA